MTPDEALAMPAAMHQAFIRYAKEEQRANHRAAERRRRG